MVDTDPVWLGAVLTKHARDKSIVGVLSVKTESAVGVGDNYGSVIVRATLQVVLGSGEVTTRKVIMKKTLPDVPQEVAAELTGAFILEGIVYRDILHKYETLINECNVTYDKFWPECLFTSNNTIIFEDLKLSGFTMGPRKTGLDPQHAEIVFRNLARLHSLSVVAVNNGCIFPKLLPPYLLVNGPFGDMFIKSAMSCFVDVIRDTWSEEWSKVEKKIRGMIENIVETLSTLYRQTHKLSVVNHGDSWTANMMFKYNSQGSPVDHKYLDFQVSHYNSYAWDLTYLLHTSVHPKFIPTNYDSFIKIYCKEFSDNLVKLGHNASLAPTIDDVKEEMIRLRPFALTLSCTALLLAANPSDVQVSLEDFVKKSDKTRIIFEDNNSKRIIQQMLTNFINLGVL